MFRNPLRTRLPAFLAGLLLVLAPASARADDPFWRTQVLRVSGPLAGSLYRSLDAVVPDSILDARERAAMAWDVADVFRWEADFVHGLRPGDRFRLVFERRISEVGEVRYGRVLAAELVLGGQPLAAYEFDAEDGRTEYYDAAGVSLRRNFLIVPVEFRRISDGFAARRFHSILRLWRAHNGIDYAAAPGTPVQAAGDGVVLRATWAGGYGRLVEIRHDNGAVTRYGHLSGFAAGIRPGAPVSQGQTVGYVGATGLATGPHLHFEFLVHGVPTDPRALGEAGGEPLAPASHNAFALSVDRLRTILGMPALLLTSRGTM